MSFLFLKTLTLSWLAEKALLNGIFVTLPVGWLGNPWNFVSKRQMRLPLLMEMQHFRNDQCAHTHKTGSLRKISFSIHSNSVFKGPNKIKWIPEYQCRLSLARVMYSVKGKEMHQKSILVWLQWTWRTSLKHYMDTSAVNKPTYRHGEMQIIKEVTQYFLGLCSKRETFRCR